MNKEKVYHIGAILIVFLFAGIFMPLTAVASIVHNDLLYVIGVIGCFSIVVPFIVYTLFFDKILNNIPPNNLEGVN